MRRLDTDCTCPVSGSLKITGKRKVHEDRRRHLSGDSVPEPLAPLKDRGIGVIPLGHLGGIWRDATGSRTVLAVA